MRTTLNLDDQLLARARLLAAARNRTLSEVLNDALRLGLEAQDRPARPRVSLPTFGQQGTQPGVDLNDCAALLDLMEQSGADL